MCESTCIATKSKSVLIVFAHQDEKSFNGALKRVAVETLESKGFVVEVSDLYSQNFEPRSTKNDVLGSLLNEEVFNYAEEGRNAFRNDSLSNDIAQEIARLKKADLVIFQFPLYWSSVPAILKGWFDRIFCDSFAFDYETQNILDQGFMKGKRAVLSLTTGCTKEMVSPQGLGSDMNVLLWHIQYGTLRMCGFDVLQPQISYGTKLVDADTRELYMKNWESRLQNIFTEEPLPFPKLSDFNPETMTLNKKNGVQEVFSIGHHTANND